MREEQLARLAVCVQRRRGKFAKTFETSEVAHSLEMDAVFDTIAQTCPSD